MIRALIFDFDGLILDSEMPDFLSWQETYRSFGVELPLDLWVANIGSVTFFNPYTHLETLLGRELDREKVKAARRRRDDELMAQQGIMPGVAKYLAEARELGLKTAVASSSRHAWVDPLLERLGIADQFDAVCCRDDVGERAKPDPAVYQAALAALNVQADEALAFEDSPNGAAAARAAGIFCVIVPNEMTSQLTFPQVDYRLASLDAMPLKQLLGQVAVNGAPYLNSNARRIREFHAAVGSPLPHAPQLREADHLAMRHRLIQEEYEEATAVFHTLIDALQNGQQLDPVEALTPLVHELADLLYVVYGAIEACGVDADAVFQEVHRANLQKAGGPRRADGKLLKPPGWQPADVRSVLQRQQENGR
ncbi:MAG: HAD-IA family hydrolase [Ardenticatenaceae bacterium]|nr:HAD-IA family hydrolase [Ardenticatenaceae bacterium]